jgi:hypothetical protein
MLLEVLITDARTSMPITTGVTVTAALIVPSSGATVPDSAITLAHVGSPDGRWHGVFPATLTTTLGTTLFARLTIDGGGEATAVVDIQVPVTRRTA